MAHLQAFAKKHNGKVVLPMALVDFNDSKSETIIKCPLQAVLTWGKPDPSKAELVIEDNGGNLWDYTGPIQKFRSHGSGIATREGHIYKG